LSDAQQIALCSYTVSLNANPPLPAALVSRGTGRLLCRARQQRPADCLCLFRE